MSAPHLIGLLGKARAGKDSFASALVADHGYTRVAFADPLKELALAIDPLTGGPHRLSSVVARIGWEEAKTILEVRRTLQAVGVGVRQLDPDFWLRAGLAQARTVVGPVVVTDVRFVNEADAIRSYGGVLVRVERPSLNSTDAHVSETQLDDYLADYRFVNDGALDDLPLDVDRFLTGISPYPEAA